MTPLTRELKIKVIEKWQHTKNNITKKKDPPYLYA